MICAFHVLPGGERKSYKTIFAPWVMPQGRRGVNGMLTWQYMTHPSFWVYSTLWVGEFAFVLIIPQVLLATAVAYCPWHFERLGTTVLGTYVINLYVAGVV